jgi:integrase
MQKVTLRYKLVCKGKMESLYLQYYPPLTDKNGNLVRYEFLHIERYKSPCSDVERKYNHDVEELAEAIRCERYLMLARKEFSFLPKEKLDGDFISYFKDNLPSLVGKYSSALKHFGQFTNGQCKFRDISTSFCEQYRSYLLREAKKLHDKKKISHNTASSYFNVFMSVVKLAGDDNIISKDIVKHVDPIQWNHDTQKEYMIEAELRQLESITFEKNDEVRRAALFSCYTGLRRSDILQLQWKDIVRNRECGNGMHIIIKKTKVEVRLPLSNKAMRILGDPKQKGRVFPSLTVSVLNEQIPELIRQAGIRKHITFHCFRYTFAQMLLDRGVDIYTIAHLLGHKQVSSAQCYVRPSDKLCQQAIRLLDK